MRNYAAVTCISVALLGGFPAAGHEKPPPEYQRAMNTLQETSELMRHHARMVEPAGDFGYAWIESDAVALKKAFEVAGAYWTRRNSRLATTFAQNAVSDAAILERAAKAKHYDGVVAGVAGVLADCEPCHRVYREELPDGTFEIR